MKCKIVLTRPTSVRLVPDNAVEVDGGSGFAGAEEFRLRHCADTRFRCVDAHVLPEENGDGGNEISFEARRGRAK